VFAQQFHHGAQRLVVAVAAVVAQALGAQLGHGHGAGLAGGVNHGRGIELQVAALLKVHALQRFG
jgi:hypothetical protein